MTVTVTKLWREGGKVYAYLSDGTERELLGITGGMVQDAVLWDSKRRICMNAKLPARKLPEILNWLEGKTAI